MNGRNYFGVNYKIRERITTFFSFDILRRIAGNSSYLFSANIVAMASGILQIAMISRMIGPEGIGIIGLFAASCGLAQILFGFRSAETIMTFVAKHLAAGDHERAKEVVIFCFFIDIASAFVSFWLVYLLIDSLLRLFNIQPSYRFLFLIYSLTILCTSPIATGNGLLRLRNRFKFSFLITTGASIIRLSMTLFLFFLNAGLREVVWIYVFGALVEGTGIFYFATSRLDSMINSKTKLPVPRLFRDIVQDKELLLFQVQGYVRDVGKSLSRYFDILLLGVLTSPIQVGYYRISKQVINYLQTPVNSLGAALYPEYSKLWFNNQISELKKTIRILIYLLFLTGVIVLFAIFLFSNNIILILFGKEFFAAQPILIILLISAFIHIVMVPLFSLPATIGNAKPALYAVAAGLIAQVITMYFLIPKFQAVGAAWSNVVYAVVWAITLMPFIRKILCENN